METKAIGNKITDARKKLSISQAQFAEGLFVSAQAVGKWERGESMPDIITFTGSLKSWVLILTIFQKVSNQWSLKRHKLS